MKKHIVSIMILFVLLMYLGDGDRVAAQTGRMPGPGSGPVSTGSTPADAITISCNEAPCRQLLLQSLRIPYAVLRIQDNVSMDLTNQPPIRIAEGVKVFGTRGPRNPGPLLYTTTSAPSTLFDIRDKNVRITGLRIRGPHAGIDGGESKPKGIAVYVGSLTPPFNAGNNIEIDNNEIFGWSGAGIQVSDSDSDEGAPVYGNVNRANAGAVHIHDNFIHHNQHENGAGYGIKSGSGGYALIERNVFDFNRHAIAASGSVGTGYIAQRNLILKGGGIHQWAGFSGHTHSFDMHGMDSCVWGSGSVKDVVDRIVPDRIYDIDKRYNCGPAGEFMHVVENSFQYKAGDAFRLRGTPKVWNSPNTRAGAFVNRNVFAHDRLDSALSQTEEGLYQSDNVVGFDSFGQYGVCDFDGDSRDDLFLATGVTWWYSSAGAMHWTYLNRSSKTVENVAFGYFDDDKRCDVFSTSEGQWVISSGGTSPWIPAPGSDMPFDQLRFGDFDGDGRTDVFRANGTRWFYASPWRHGWEPLLRTNYRIEDLRFGDFNDDGRTDVLSLYNNEWSVSDSGELDWRPLNSRRSSRLKDFVIIDLDGDRADDILLYDSSRKVWLVSWEGRGVWRELNMPDLKELIGDFPVSSVACSSCSDKPYFFWGRFDDQRGPDALVIDRWRNGNLASSGQGAFTRHSRQPY